MRGWKEFFVVVVVIGLFRIVIWFGVVGGICWI